MLFVTTITDYRYSKGLGFLLKEQKVAVFLIVWAFILPIFIFTTAFVNYFEIAIKNITKSPSMQCGYSFSCF